MAVIRGRQTFVNDGGGKSTTSSSTYTAPKTTTTTSSYTAPKTTTSSTYTAPKTTVISSSNYGAPRAVVPVTPQVKTTTPASTPVTTAPTYNLVKNETRDLGLSGYKAGSTITDEGTKTALTPKQEVQVNKTKNNLTTPASYRTTNEPDTGTGGNKGGGGIIAVEPEPEPTYGGGGSGSGSSPSQSEAEKAQKEVEDTVAKLKELLDEQKRQAEDYYKTLYEQQLASNLTDWENNRNQINRNYMRTNRYLNSMYGDAVSGVGLSNRARNYSNWNNNLAQNDRNRTNNDATALANYDSNLANVASQLAQGYYNYVLPVYTNRQTNADNMDYQVWALQQQLENRRQMNLDDLDYRKYLASLGL